MRHFIHLLAIALLTSNCGPGNPAADGGDAAPAVGCTSDGQCAAPTPRCDKNTNQCVPCLPQNDNCPMGSRCVPQNNGFACSAVCAVDADCPGGGHACCNGVCTDTAGDSANCGGCGKTCPAYANAAVVCATGVCALGACNPGFADCDKQPANGCEANTQTDATHCGGCGTACTAGANQSPSCAGGACQTTCLAGFADCDKLPANGCEANLIPTR